MLCVDVAPADGASIQQTLKLLEEKLKSVGKQILKMLKHKGSFKKILPWLHKSAYTELIIIYRKNGYKKGFLLKDIIYAKIFIYFFIVGQSLPSLDR